MPQIQLPIFPVSSTAITSELAFEQRDGQVYYFNGHLPVFTHPVDDIASFRFFTSQLIANGSASQSQISKAFGVPLVTVKRACKKLRVEGASAFFRPSPPRQGRKLTPELLVQAQALLDDGMEVPAIAERLGILPNTLHKAISHNRLKKRSRPTKPRTFPHYPGTHHPKRTQRPRRPCHHGRGHHPSHGPRRRRHGRVGKSRHRIPMRR